MIDIFRKVLADLDVEFYMNLESSSLIENDKDSFQIVVDKIEERIVATLDFREIGLGASFKNVNLWISKQKEHYINSSATITIDKTDKNYLDALRVARKFAKRQKLRVKEKENLNNDK